MRLWKVLDPVKIDNVKDLIKKIEEGTKNNLKIWEDTVPFKYEQYYGYAGTGFNLCTTISGVIPLESEQELELTTGWRYTKDRGVIPNGRTKQGKEALRAIEDGTIQVPYGWVYSAVGLKSNDFGRFTLPNAYQSKDGTEVYVKLDAKYELDNDPKFEEVTISYVNKKLNGVQEG